MALTIPADLDAWNPSDVQDWLAALHEDPSVRPDELARATRAANAAILGEDYDADQDCGHDLSGGDCDYDCPRFANSARWS